MKKIILNDAEISSAIWISQKFANETNKSFSGVLGQVLNIMTKAIQDGENNAKKPIYCKPEYYKDKIVYSWVKGPDKVSTNSLSSIEMLIVVKLAMLSSINHKRPFTRQYDIALEMVLEEKEKYEKEHSNSK